MTKLVIDSLEPLTDKPAKALPAALWTPHAPAVTPETLKPRARELAHAIAAANSSDGCTEAQQGLIAEGVAAGLVNDDCRRPVFTESGYQWAREAGAYSAAV